VQSLSRLVKEDDPFFLTLSFHNPHAPMVAAGKYFDYYFENREDLFIPPSIIDDGSNSGYGVSKYNDPDKVREWMACYYALVEEIDEWVGVLLDTLDAHPDVRDNTIVVFTSDHGEMLGAHGLNEKNKFLEESAHIPLLIKAPGKIEPGTVVENDVNLLDLFSTVLDYANASSYDNSHGTSMRRFIENKSYNEAYDESHIVTEWDYRDPKGNSLSRSLGGEINFHSKKGAYKLMMTKKANSSKIDMLYNIDEDPYEMNNLIGNNGMTASDYTIGKAEHLKALLVDWMLRLDGEDKIYSDPKWNNDEGDGDIAEIRERRGWRTLDLWVCDTLIHFGNAVDVNGTLTRNEWIYLGRTTDGTTNISSITLEGSDADLFTVSEFTNGAINTNDYKKVKVQYTPTSLNYLVSDAKLRIKHDTGDDIVIDLVNGERNTSDNTVIDDCDELTNWTGDNILSPNSDYHQQGRSCVEARGNSKVDFQKVFSSPVNTGANVSEAKLQMWYYVSDVSLLTDENQVELGSAGTADADVYSWNISKTDLHNGWNYVSLNFSDAEITGSPNINAINWFRLYRGKTDNLRSRIDYIQVAADDMPKPGMPVAVYPKAGAAGIDVNVAIDWIAGKNTLEHEVYFGKTDPPAHVATQSDNSYRLENLDDNTTYYWQIKEKNPSGISEGEVWSFKTMGPPGANYNGMPSDGSTGISTTSSVKWIAGNYAETHNVYFGTTNPPPFIKNQVGTSYTPDEPLDFETTYYWRADAVNEVDTTAGKIYSYTTRAKDASGMIVLDDCDSRSGWGGSNFEGVNYTDQKQGDGCIYGNGSSTNEFQRTFNPAINTGIAEADAKLVFWYYVSDVSQLGSSGQFELGSGNKADIDEWNWQIDVSTLHNGWNKMELDITDAGSRGTPSLSNINWFRIYRKKQGKVETRIDYIHIVDKTVTPKAPEKAENPYPANESSNVSLSPKLTWTAGVGTISHNIYVGTADSLEFLGNQFGRSYQLSNLDSSTVYYWRIDEVNEAGTTTGDVWTFTTLEPQAVYKEVIHNSNFKVSPNPSYGIVYLETDMFEDAYMVNVYDLSGRLVHREELAVAKKHLNLTNLDKGTYILEVKTKINRSTTKVILE
ncbi:MAG TPA: sulfatase-like hydrolase/transferase, partial [Bacteroidales bacterium]|nr:sulfatase-like hydrolase/transferase [Bacteroidales bacterium]